MHTLGVPAWFPSETPRRVAAAFGRWRFLALVEWSAVAATSLWLAIMGVTAPLYNWDLINYVAAAYTSAGLSGRALSERVYADVRAEVGPTTFATLVTGEYRQAVWRDPEALRQQVPIARIRVFYVALMQLLHRAGASLPQATYVISAAATAGAALVLGMLCRTLGLSPLLVPLVVASCGYVRLARLSTPDALACLGALTTMWLWLSGRAGAYLVAALLPLVRSDFVLLPALLAAVDVVAARRRAVAMVAALVAGGIYLWVNVMAGGYGWRMLLHLTFIVGAFPYPERLPLSSDLGPYLRVYWRGVLSVLGHPHVLIYAGALVAYWQTRLRHPMPQGQAGALGVMTAFVAVHWLFFPVYGERFFSAPASVVLLVLVAHVWRLLGAQPGPAAPAATTT